MAGDDGFDVELGDEWGDEWDDIDMWLIDEVITDLLDDVEAGGYF